MNTKIIIISFLCFIAQKSFALDEDNSEKNTFKTYKIFNTPPIHSLHEAEILDQEPPKSLSKAVKNDRIETIKWTWETEINTNCPSQYKVGKDNCITRYLVKQIGRINKIEYTAKTGKFNFSNKQYKEESNFFSPEDIERLLSHCMNKEKGNIKIGINESHAWINCTYLSHQDRDYYIKRIYEKRITFEEEMDKRVYTKKTYDEWEEAIKNRDLYFKPKV